MSPVLTLGNKGLRIGGIVTPEVRVKGRRTGFKIIDLSSGKEGILASVNQTKGPRISKYRINLSDVDKVGVTAIKKALVKTDLVAIDELGPMEFRSKEFIEVVKDTVASGKPLLATIHSRMRHPLLEKMKTMKDAKIFTVTLDKIGTLTEELTEIILKEINK